jgi:4-hydroxy-4-methyl-2-oxoglutarate aldolase
MSFLTKEQLDALTMFDTPTICNAIESFHIRSRTEGFTRPELRLRASINDKPMVGYARTGIISARHPASPQHNAIMESYYRQYEKFDLPMVAAIQDLDTVPVGSFWGDVQATVHRALGCIGVITNGGVRDIEEVKKVGFYLFSKEILISHAYIHMIEAGTPVDICGMTVRSGDLIHADQHGAIVIPEEVASNLADVCIRVVNAENALLEPCRLALDRGERVTASQIMTWRAEMQRRREAIHPDR